MYKSSVMQNYSPEDLEQGRRALLGGSVGAVSPFTVSRAEGSEVWDTDGRRYIEGQSQAWSLSIGHSHPRIIKAVTEHLKNYSHFRTNFDTVPKLLLAKKLIELAPRNMKRVGFCLSGSEAMEGAMKLAMRETGRQSFITLDNAFHGRTLATMSLSWPHPGAEAFEDGWMNGPVVRVPAAYCYRCPVQKTYPSCQMACVDQIKDVIAHEIDYYMQAKPAAIVMEPFQGNGGMIEFPKEFMPAMRKLADELGALLILDESQTGMGRMGEWFACQLYGVEPDIIVVGKGISGGFPLFATLVSERVKANYQPGDHSFTFAHFSPSMVAALATIEVLEEEKLLMRSKFLGTQILAWMKVMQVRHEFIGDVRGIGLMLGMEIVKNKQTREPDPERAHRMVKTAQDRGLLLGESKYGGLGNVVKFKPPLNCPRHLVDEALDIMELIFQEEENVA